MWLYRVMQALVHVLLIPLFLIRREHSEKIPRKNKALLVGNHIHQLDPIVMCSMTPRWLRFMAKKELFERSPLGWCARKIGAFPINRGTADMTSIKTALDILKNDGMLAIFPEGRRNPNIDGPMLPLHEGVALLALKSGAPVIPFYIKGKYRPFSGIRLIIGDPVDLSDLDTRRTDRQTLKECMRRVRQAIHALGGIIDDSFDK